MLLLTGIFAFMLAGDLDHRAIPQKWGTAILGTAITFGMVIYASRQVLNRWAFWVSLSICFGAHVILVWLLFKFGLVAFERFSILLWCPVMIAEVFVLFVATKRIHDKLTGNREIWTFKF